MDKKLRVMIIGAGQIARTTHLPALKNMEEAEVSGISDVNGKAAETLAEEFGIPVWGTDAAAMEKELRPDAVMVCVSNRFHYSLVMEALRGGAHVFCEKPPALTPGEAEEMEKTARECGRILTYGFHFRHDERTALLKKAIEDGRLGKLYHAEAVWNRRRGIPGWGVFTNRGMQGGGALIDLGGHILDLAAYLLDYPEPVSVSASMSDRIGKQGGTGLMGAWSGETFTVEDGLFGTICFEGGISLTISTTFALHQKAQNERKVLVFGDRAGASLFDGELYTADEDGLRDESLGETGENTPDTAHARCDENFVRACLGREEILVKDWQGTYVQRLIAMLYEAAGR